MTAIPHSRAPDAILPLAIFHRAPKRVRQDHAFNNLSSSSHPASCSGAEWDTAKQDTVGQPSHHDDRPPPCCYCCCHCSCRRSLRGRKAVPVPHGKSRPAFPFEGFWQETLNHEVASMRKSEVVRKAVQEQNIAPSGLGSRAQPQSSLPNPSLFSYTISSFMLSRKQIGACDMPTSCETNIRFGPLDQSHNTFP